MALNTSETYSLARLRAGGGFGSCNGGWNVDAYPELEPLNAGRRICIADIRGPAVITHIHSTAHGHNRQEHAALVARGVVLEIVFDEAARPSVVVPLGDFFADANGHGSYFSSLFIEHAPKAYNCFIPMPFAKRAQVFLRNDTEIDIGNYSFVEFRRLPEWDPGLGYFHATWRRFAFPLTPETDQPFFHIDGHGHLLGCCWTVTSQEPLFRRMTFVMEGNVELRLEGERDPVADYLGSEDSFGFSWGFQECFGGLRNGLTLVSKEDPAQITAYRFRDDNIIPFDRALDVRVDWSHDWKWNTTFLERLRAANDAGGGIVDYATVWYWYQSVPGFDHEDLPEVEVRCRVLARPSEEILE